MAYRLGLDRFKKAETAEPFDVNALKVKAPQQQQLQSSVPRFSAAVPQPFLAPTTAAAVAAASLPPPLAYLAAHFASPSPPAQALSAVQTGTPTAAGLLAASDAAAVTPASRGALATAVGAGGSQWVPPEWAVDPKPGLFSLEVLKDGKAVDSITLDKKRTIFGRQATTCDFVLDHPSVSRQHAAVVHHRNGRLYVMDLGSVHGTFVSTERVQKDAPLELEPGQSLRFAASTRVYVLVRAQSTTATSTSSSSSQFLPPRQEAPVQVPDPPDPNDSDAVLAYNTLLNRLGMVNPAESAQARCRDAGEGDVGNLRNSEKGANETEASASAAVFGDRRSETKPARKRKFDDGAVPAESSAEREGIGGRKQVSRRVSFRDEHGGELEVVVGFSDGADVATEPGPIGVKEGSSLVGKFDSLVKSTIIPRGAPKVPSSTASSGSGEGDGRLTTAAAAAAAVAAAGSFVPPSTGAFDTARVPGGGSGSSGPGSGVTDSFKAYLNRVKGGGLYGVMGIGQSSGSKSSMSGSSLAPPLPWAAKRRDGENGSREGVDGTAHELRKGKGKRSAGVAEGDGAGPSAEEAAADWSRMPRRPPSGRIAKDNDDDDDDLFGDDGD